MISVKNLNYVYTKSKKHAVKDVTFDIGAGEIFGFLGPNGAGKTTTQRLIIGLLKHYQGEINIMDRERRDWDKSFFEHIGVAFEFPNLYTKLTAEENLSLISAYYQNGPKDIDGVLDSVGLLKDKKQKIEGFSKGMKMRLNFVRAVMHNPALMFFDEPTSGLDPVNAKIIKQKILDMKAAGKTIFLTTHNMTVAEQLCDRVAFINEGEISTIDSPRNLMVAYGKSVLDVTYRNQDALKTETFKLENIADNKPFQDILKKRDIVSMHTQEASLEDVFITFTGRALK